MQKRKILLYIPFLKTVSNAVDDMQIKEQDLVVTSNRYVEASYFFTANEEKIIYCAMVSARKLTVVDQDTFIDVYAHDFGALVGLDDREAFRALKRASATLKKRFVSFFEPDPSTGQPSELEVPLFTALRYVPSEGVIRLRFTKEIIPHFMQLIGGNFTQHEIGYLARLSSVYAIRLYRMLHKELWKAKPIDIELEELRYMLQLGDKYTAIKDFKINVIDIAVREINQTTDLTVSYENIKHGRSITGLRFLVRKDQQADTEQKVVTETPVGLTEKQAAWFASKLASDPVFGSEHALMGEETMQFIERIRQALLQADAIQTYRPYLEKHGFQEDRL